MTSIYFPFNKESEAEQGDNNIPDNSRLYEYEGRRLGSVSMSAIRVRLLDKSILTKTRRSCRPSGAQPTFSTREKPARKSTTTNPPFVQPSFTLAPSTFILDLPWSSTSLRISIAKEKKKKKWTMRYEEKVERIIRKSNNVKRGRT